MEERNRVKQGEISIFELQITLGSVSVRPFFLGSDAWKNGLAWWQMA